ncbi:Ig-like domain-containing protein [Flavicella sp.]|uniref:Ig-like domain-containing protein n=1 Tax=Flavicella sp. TaxID=2957742 RepID=UPI0026057D6B|nr:Ig-like domain-containing protein [Flavicella sp.]MDG1805194.1 Ig-like domain-containing protein [Flavicella sp.]
MKKLFILSIFSLLIIAITTSCARKGSPTGGPKDSIAPVMVTATPEHEAINFNSKKIKLQFDEYVKFKDLNKQLIVSPPLKHQSDITPVGTASKKITIKINDTLKENTTYSFNFGNSIVDNNEGNPLGSFKYVFSTGSYVDSLEIYGLVKDSYERVFDTEISVLLFEVTEDYNDSIIYKEKPSYMTNTLDSIVFDITNIKEGTYQLVALKDYNNNYQFDPRDDKIAFSENYINIPTDSFFTLNLFKEAPAFKLKRPLEKRVGKIIFGYEGERKGLDIKLLTETPENFKSFIAKEKDKDTLNFWFTPFEADSLQFLVRKDTLEKKYTVKLRTKKLDSLDISAPINGSLHPKDTFYLESNFPFASVDPENIYVTDQDTLAVTFQPSFNKEKSKLYIDFERIRNGSYQIDILPNAFQSFHGKTNDTLQYILKTQDIEAFAILELNIKNPNNKNLIVELLSGKDDFVVEKRITSKSENYEFADLKPATYLVRIIFDDNKNKIWDTGNFLNKIQPEKVYYFETELKLKANWTVNETIDIESIP